jgi:hypothetical protein
MTLLPRLLRKLADKLGGETDLDLQARMLGLMRGHYPGGTRAGLERAIQDWAPAGTVIECEWHVRNGDEVLMVRFRR